MTRYNICLSNICDRRFLLRVITFYMFATLVLLVVYPFNNSGNADQVSSYILSEEERNYEHRNIVNRYYEARKQWNTSNLGSILFKNEPCKVSEKNKTFVVLIWRYWNWLKIRHVEGFNANREDPLEDCSVKNCKFIGNDDELDTADAVVIHIQHGLIPTVESRNRKQRWVFLNDESPQNSFSMTKSKPNLANWSNVFNWSMMYRSDADIPVPYGRTISLTESCDNLESVSEHVPNWGKKRRDVLVTVLMSNCNVRYRMEFLKELQKYLKVDVYGKCSPDKKKSCPGHFKSDCDDISEYLFYLVLENSQCHQYITEKGYNNAYSKGAIPIILGPTDENCKTLLPPNSYLHAKNYETANELAEKLVNISQNNETLLSYHQWRNHFKVVNEHGYLDSKSYHLCRLCEGLNYNDESEKIYDENSLRLFLDPKLSCT